MDLNNKSNEEIISYYTRQIHKTLYLFEERDYHGYKHAYKIMRDIEYFPEVFPQINKPLLARLLLKLSNMYEEMLAMDVEDEDSYQYVKNLYFESRDLLMEIKEGL